MRFEPPQFGIATAGTLLGAFYGMICVNSVYDAGPIWAAETLIKDLIFGALLGIAVDLAVNGIESRGWTISLRVLMLAVAACAAACFGLINYWRMVEMGY